ncbi:alpha/beta hydrolase [Actinoplanes philippinensis]|uniref:alpha/beta hydrolase n=1 Tax=Actinoplanes philippinensis TaxID=35752 RepID=UPI0033C983F3
MGGRAASVRSSSRSWEQWAAHYERRGLRVVTPGYPGFEVEVEALNANPGIVAALTVPAIVDRLASVIAGLDRPPIIIGHSHGGVFTQMLLDSGLGAAGVTLNSAPAGGVRVAPRSQIRSTPPVLRSPANRHRPVALTFDEWWRTFANTFGAEEARALYDRCHVPASGRILWSGVLAGFQPGGQETAVDYRNDDRAPLLFVSGGADLVMPPAVQRANVRHYTSRTVTEHVEYPGYAHLLPAQKGWEEIADHVLDWALWQSGVRPEPAPAGGWPGSGRSIRSAPRR